MDHFLHVHAHFISMRKFFFFFFRFHLWHLLSAQSAIGIWISFRRATKKNKTKRVTKNVHTSNNVGKNYVPAAAGGAIAVTAVCFFSVVNLRAPRPLLPICSSPASTSSIIELSISNIFIYYSTIYFIYRLIERICFFSFICWVRCCFVCVLCAPPIPLLLPPSPPPLCCLRPANRNATGTICFQ